MLNFYNYLSGKIFCKKCIEKKPKYLIICYLCKNK